MPQFNLNQMRVLEDTMDSLCRAGFALCDTNTTKKINDLRYLVAEMRVLSGNPRDSEAINRFADLFTK